MSTKDKKKLTLRAIPLRQLDPVVGGAGIISERLRDFQIDRGALQNALGRLGTGRGLGNTAITGGTDYCPGPASGTDDGGPKNCEYSKSTACKTDSVCQACV